MDSAGPGEIGGTYGGNPIGCAAGLAVIESVEKDNIEMKAKATADAAAARLDAMAEKYALIGEHRGLGAMRAIELVKDPLTKEPAADEAKAIVKRCHEKGLIIITAGIFGNVIRFLMPVNIPSDQLNRGLEILEEAIAQEQGGK